jgi:uridine phosphorylase
MSSIDKRLATEGRTQYHLRMRRGDVGKYVLMPGDRARVAMMSSYLEDAKEVGNNREYLAHTGFHNGIKVTVMSTGMGCPAAAIAVEELANIGAGVFIRTGSTGALQKPINVGDLIIANGAVKNEGTSRMYEPNEFPAVPSFRVLNSLVSAAESLKEKLRFRYHVGIVSSDDAFYAETPEFVRRMTALGALGLDMETSAIFVVSRARGLESGSIMSASENFARKSIVPERVPEALRQGWRKETQVALRAIEVLDGRRSD